MHGPWLLCLSYLPGCTEGYGEAFSGECRRCPSKATNTVFYVLSYLLSILLLLITIRTQLGKGIDWEREAIRRSREYVAL